MLDPCTFFLELAKACLSASSLSLLLLIQLSPKTFLLTREVLLVPRAHVLQEPLFPQYLLLLQLPEAPLLLYHYELNLLLQLLLSEPLLDLRPLSHLLHLLGLLLESLPNELRL